MYATLGGSVPNTGSTASISENYFSSVVLGNSKSVTIGSTRQQAFSDGIEYLGVSGIRWPGGTEAERNFDWRTDASSTHPLDISDLHNAIDYAAENDLGFSFTFPTAEFKGQSDAELNGQADQIKSFIVNELLSYSASAGVSLDSIKIGNEYDLNGLSASEYGDIASSLAKIIGEAISDFEASATNFVSPKIVVESGRIWLQEFGTSGSFFGDRDHNGIMDAQEIKDAFDASEAQYVDAVDIHSLTLFTSSFGDYFGDSPYSDASLNTIYKSLSSFWDDTFQDAEIYSLAWQYPWMRDADGPSGPQGVIDHGGASLANASLGFMQFFEMSLAGVSYAASWAASGWGGASPTLFNVTPRAGGEMFKLMEENLVGLKAVEFTNDPSVFNNNADVTDVVLRAFASDGKAVLYVGNLEDEAQSIKLDSVLQFLETLDGFEGVSDLDDPFALYIGATRLGVDGDPMDYRSIPEVDFLSSGDLLSSTDASQQLEFELDAYEIMQIVFSSDQGISIEGRGSDDTLVGSNWADTISGGNGNDSLQGGLGDDKLKGGLGKDTLSGEAGNDALFGGGGRDKLFGGAGNDELYGDGGDDKLFGGKGSDKLFGGDRNDKLFGGAGNDDLSGGEGNDKIWGEDGNDTLFGGAGNDVLMGDAGRDTLSGGDGNDRIWGGSGVDWMSGGAGKDLIGGGAGDDTLLGGNGDDELRGGKGNDTLNGGAGDDILTGKFDADTFVFADGFGQDLITDFDVADDFERIDLSAVSAITDFTDLAANHMAQVGSDVLIDDGAGNTITLAGVSLADLDQIDFLF